MRIHAQPSESHSSGLRYPPSSMNSSHSAFVTSRSAKAWAESHVKCRGPSQSNENPEPSCPICTAPKAPSIQRSGSGAVSEHRSARAR